MTTKKKKATKSENDLAGWSAIINAEPVKKREQKTLFMFNTFTDEVFFFEMPGGEKEWSHLQNVYLNSSEHSDEVLDALNDLVYGDEGKIKVKKLFEPTKDWDYFVTCGFVP